MKLTKEAKEEALLKKENQEHMVLLKSSSESVSRTRVQSSRSNDANRSSKKRIGN